MSVGVSRVSTCRFDPLEPLIKFFVFNGRLVYLIGLQFAGPGGWNDIDMLEVGNGGMTLMEYQLHFSFWCLLKAPLILGFDMYTKMTPEYLDLITNTELLAINQDKLGVQVSVCNIHDEIGSNSGV